MEFILITILVVVVIAFIAYPLFTPSHAETASAASALDSLIAQRDSVYDAIRDLDFDFQLGKLSQSDYVVLREKYKARAALALQEIDVAVSDDGALDAQIEAQVAQLRTHPNRDGAIEREVARLRETKIKHAVSRCGNCGTPCRAGDRFCASCGSKL